MKGLEMSHEFKFGDGIAAPLLAHLPFSAPTQ